MELNTPGLANNINIDVDKISGIPELFSNQLLRDDYWPENFQAPHDRDHIGNPRTA